MKNPLLFPVLIGILFIFSCKKDNSAPDNSSLPKTYTEDIRSSGYNSLTVYNLTYDGNNRLVSMAAIPEPSIVKFIYQYANDNSMTMDLYNSDVLKIREQIWLNSAGLVDSTYQYNNTQDTSTEKYIYNSDKQLTQMKRYQYYYTGSVLFKTTDYVYDNNGNPVSETDNSRTITYQYYPDLMNTMTMGLSYYPLPKNLIKSASTASGGNTVTATHFYTFDSNNRLTQDSASTNVDVTVIKSYTY